MLKTNYLINIRDVNFSVSPDADSFLNLIHANEIELLNLSGGIPQNGINEILHVVEYDNLTNSFIFSSECELFEIERELFWNERFIDNKLLSVFSTGRGTGTIILINEIIQARKLGITHLKVSAAKNERFNGYYTWARLGYSIDSPDDQEQFDELISNHGRSEKSMIELMQTEDGRDFWRQNGFWWQGIFDLSRESENIQAINNYLIQAGINFSL
jgi:hypothetical protein